MSPPVIVLGVSRSGTTLLKEMFDAHSELAIPTESYFIPQLAGRHGDRVDVEAFLADLGRLARVSEWGVSLDQIRGHLPERPTFAEAIQAVYLAYAEAQGKSRFGDKTPAYMQELELLARVFPDAQYVHLVRDGRDAGLSFVDMRRRPRFNWARPRGLAAFACQWKLEVEAARTFGRRRGPQRYLELRYEDLVAEPEAKLRGVCEFLGLGFEPAMLEYHKGTLRLLRRYADVDQLLARMERLSPDPRRVRLQRAENRFFWTGDVQALEAGLVDTVVDNVDDLLEALKIHDQKNRHKYQRNDAQYETRLRPATMFA